MVLLLLERTVVHAEVGFHELSRLTANVPQPNEFTTAFAFKVLRDLAPHFGPYASLLRVLCAELELAAYAQEHALPYFALVKHQKQLVRTLRRDKCALVHAATAAVAPCSSLPLTH